MKRPPINRKNRRGITLIEVILAASIMILIIGIGTGLIWKLMQLNSATRSKNDRQRTAARLSETFRDDARRAKEVELKTTEKEKTEGVVFKYDKGQTVHYTFGSTEVFRRVNQGRKQIAVDSFACGKNLKFEVDLQSQGKDALVVLTARNIAIKQTAKGMPPIVARIGARPEQIEITLPPPEEDKEEAEEEATEEETQKEAPDKAVAETPDEGEEKP